MPAITSTAPGKIILFGEHAVVYHRPAIAVPVQSLRTRVVITADPLATPGTIHIEAPAINLNSDILDLVPEDHLVLTITNIMKEIGITYIPACNIRISSTIPVAAGLGSGAAASVALIRAFSTFLGKPFPDDLVNKLAFEIEKIHHGTPSGIDNTVITYNMPVYFQYGQPLQKFQIKLPFTILIADTGVPSKTAITVRKVRQGWEQSPEKFENIFDEIAEITNQGKHAIEIGNILALGKLMDQNQILLQAIGVSSAEIGILIDAAKQAGAIGAKLSGGGGGGNIIALVDEESAKNVGKALLEAGAKHVYQNQLRTSH